MNDAEAQRLKKRLVKNKFMDESDNIIDYAQGTTKERILGKWGAWKPGWIYFTEKKICCFWGLIGSLEINYDSIHTLRKCRQLIFPFGIAITHTNKDGKVVEDKIYVQKRNERIKLISERSGVEISE